MQRLLFLFLFSFSAPLAAQCDDPGPDLQSLLDIYRNTNGPNWLNRSGWELGDLGLDCDYCNWAGVNCDGDGRVIRLFLGDNGLNGTLPPSLNSLDRLVRLVLKRANIGSSITEIAGLPVLDYLDIYQVNVSGPFPAELLTLTQLRDLDISYNNFTGEVPDFSALPFLRRLSLDANAFSGPPPALAAMDQLREISMRFNDFTGRIPESWNSDNLPRLESLDALNCKISGPVPAWLATLAGADINLQGNQLSGCYSEGLAPFCNNSPPNLIGNAGLPSNGSGSFFASRFCEQGESCPPCPEEMIITHDSILLNYRAIYPNCVDLAGDLHISGNGITNLNGIATVETIGGDLVVEDTDIADLEGLGAVTSVAGDWIVQNATLASIRPLKSIRIVGGSLELRNLPNLSGNGFSGEFSGLTEVSESFKADNLPQITSLQSFGNINQIPGTLLLSDLDAMTTFDGPGYLNIQEVNLFQIYDNDLLEHVDYFRDLAFLHIGNLLITGNPELQNLNGFDEAGRIDRVGIANNPKLKICAVPPICRGYDPEDRATLFFSNNGYGCESAAQVELDCNGNLPALPVELLRFNAHASGKVNQLEWAAVKEIDFDHYAVERSTNDGLSWQVLKKVSGAAAGAGEGLEEQSGTIRHYSATDDAPSRNTLYRLRMVDLDGSFGFSPVVAVEREEASALRVFPNPSRGSFVVSQPAATPATLTLHDAAGREVWRADNVSTETLRVPTTGFPTGVYFLRLRAGQRTFGQRVVLR